jgi:hypothetical protein
VIALSRIRKLQRRKRMLNHSAAAVKAVFATALEGLRQPTWIVVGDAKAVAATNAEVATRLLPRAQLEMVPRASHYAFLSTCTPTAVASARVCALAGPQDPARLAIEKAGEFFARYLTPGRSLEAMRICEQAVQPLASAVCAPHHRDVVA